MFNDYSDCDDFEDLVAQRRHDRQLTRQLINHPDPRDPDYPGDDDDES